MAERHRARLAAVLAADAERGSGFTPSPLHGDPHQVADAFAIERLERVPLEHAVLEVVRQELALGVVAREAERRLRQVVRAEGEEVRDPGDLVGANAGPRGSIIVPQRYATDGSSAATRSVSSRSRRSSSPNPTSGCMISTSGASPVRSSTARAARTIARTCIS